MKILDVSHHNGTVNWMAVADEADSVFIKVTEGQTLVDPMFLKNATLATEVGLKVGYYHFATLRSHEVEADAKNEANWFVENIKKAPPPTLPLVLDFEDTKIVLNREDALTFITTFFRQLILHGYHDYMLYSGTSFLNKHLPANHTLGCVPLWLADYTEPYFIPTGWQKVTLHQYTEKGTIAGIKGNVDLNRYV